MNNEFAAECSAATLRRVEVAKASEVADKVRQIYRLTFSREPAPKELARAEAFLGSKPDDKLWQHFVQALLMSNEFAFVD